VSDVTELNKTYMA